MKPAREARKGGGEGRFVLRYDDPGPNEGTFFIGFKGSSFLPTFGGTQDEAYRFATRAEAASAFAGHFAMGGCNLVDTEEAPNPRRPTRRRRK